MQTSWDVEEARNLIAAVHGSEQLALARTTLASLAERQTYASYHYHEYRRVLHVTFDSQIESQSLLEIALPHMLQDRWNINHPLTQASAHVMACIQSLHASLDTMAHAVYYALGMNLAPNALREHDVSLHRVIKALEGNVAAQNVLAHLTELQRSPILKHLSALVNHSKHRRVLHPSFSVDLRDPDKETYKLEFPEFSHNNASYPSIGADKLLEDVQAALSPTLVSCGNEVNNALRELIGNKFKPAA